MLSLQCVFRSGADDECRRRRCLAAAELALTDRPLDEADDQRHQDDEGGAVGEGDAVVIMSNGGFGGLHQKLIAALKVE